MPAVRNIGKVRATLFVVAPMGHQAPEPLTAVGAHLLRFGRRTTVLR
jgi:hypothetical protein